MSWRSRGLEREGVRTLTTAAVDGFLLLLLSLKKQGHLQRKGKVRRDSGACQGHSSEVLIHQQNLGRLSNLEAPD